MNRIRFLGAAALALAGLQAAPAYAQAMVPQPNPDADRLAGDIRMLAGNPRDLTALLDAGMTSARLGDTSAALAFFQRAEAIDPGNPRIAAGRGMALVRLERPGEALRLFQLAEARGLPVADYAADRGFAYDLLGQPGLAQRDYQTALARGEDEETLRRYALSLGISGDKDAAMRALDPLLRRSDRAAWRARAFVLAMNGDTDGAERIAGSMMPGNMGQALSPFFRRLAGLGPADRAFAVHFGELSPTQARLADARTAPVLPRYVPAPRPVVATAAPVAAPPAPRGGDRRSRRDRDRAAPVTTGSRVEIAAVDPEGNLPPPPRFTAPEVPLVQPIPAPTRAQEPVEVASRPATPFVPARSETRLPVRSEATPAPAPLRTPPVTLARAEPRPAPVVVARAETPPEVRSEPAPQPAPVRAEPVTSPPPSPVESDAGLASIVGNITIPAEELAVVTAAPETAPAPAPVRVAAAKPPAAPKPKPDAAKPKPETGKADAAKPGAKGKPEPAKADPKKKPEPKKPDPAKTDPSRIWVQVAGGANEDSLAKAWRAVVAKAPAAMKGRGAWTTPLRATNRVLAGPFKTAAEAQNFVNTLGKAGVSAFVFTSEAGQKVTKLAL
jgi:Flp pilus assembly protein TadD